MSKRHPDHFNPSENGHKKSRTIRDLYPILIDLINQCYSMTRENIEIIHTSEFKDRFKVAMDRLRGVINSIIFEYENDPDFTSQLRNAMCTRNSICTCDENNDAPCPRLLQSIISQAENLNAYGTNLNKDTDTVDK